MKTVKDSTRPKGNYDGPTLGQSSCFGREKNWEMGTVSVKSVKNNTKGQLQVIGYGALSAKLQCIPSSVIGCSVKHMVPLQTSYMHTENTPQMYSRAGSYMSYCTKSMLMYLVLSSNTACVYLDKFEAFWLIGMVIFYHLYISIHVNPQTPKGESFQ